MSKTGYWHVSAVVVTFAALVGYHLASAGLTGEKPSLVWVSILFTLFGLLQAAYVLGWRRAAVFFALGTVLSWISESHSIATANVGAYYYTNVLGPKLGQVPMVIPLSWFMMMYPSYIIANLIVLRRPTVERTTVGQAIWLAFLAGVIQTAWDLSLDPYMVGVVKAWIWEDGGPYFGIPWANYYGWVVVVTGISLAYRLIERFIPLRPAGPVSFWIASMPVAIFALNWASDLLMGEPVATRLIATFAMGISVLVATQRLLVMYYGSDPPVEGAGEPAEATS